MTSDINAVYQLSVEKSADPGKINNEQEVTVQSNTVNQIVEMFDAHVIH